MLPYPWIRARRPGLREWILWILRESPKNGAEIMDEVEARTMGLWRPSPGSVYPLLSSMASEGLIARRPDGRYELTPKGLAAVGGPRASGAEEALTELESIVAYLKDVGVPEGMKPRLLGLARELEAMANA